MRFLSGLGSCWGVATVTPAATETTPSALNSRELQEEEVVGGGLGRQVGNSSHAAVATPAGGIRKVKSTCRHWKPSLLMISEDGVMISDKGRTTSGVGSDDKKLSAKVKANSRGKTAKPTYQYHGEDYWKSSSLWAIPAFAPSPF